MAERQCTVLLSALVRSCLKSWSSGGVYSRDRLVGCRSGGTRLTTKSCRQVRGISACSVATEYKNFDPGGYAQHGLSSEALELFRLMEKEGFKPDDITLVSALAACSRAGLVDGGQQPFDSVNQDFGIHPTIQHYAGMADLLSRAGHLQQAEHIIINMPFQPDAVMWLSLLGACKTIKNLDIGRRAFHNVPKLEPKNHAAYVLVSNLCIAAGKQDDAASTRKEMQETRLRKVPGRSWISVNNDVHAFLAGDMTHSETELILLELKRLTAMVGNSRGEDKSGSLPPFGTSFRLIQNGQVRKTSEPVEPWDQQAEHLSLHFLQALVQECTQKKDIAAGRQAHALIQQHGLASNTLVGGQLVHMFASFGNVMEAKQAFDKISSPDAFAWAAIISAHGRNGQSMEAIGLYQRMQHSGTKPNGYVFVAALKSCTNAAGLKQGKLIHAHIVESGYESDVFVGSTLIDMYAKCGSLQDTRNVFFRLPSKNVVSWTAMISACAQHGHGQEALRLFKEMQVQGLEPDRLTFCSALKACSSIAALEQGRAMHSEIRDRGMEADVVVGSTLMDMYSSCGSIEDARAVFDKLSKKDVIAWTTMIAGCAEHGRCWEALQLYEQMQQGGFQPNNVTFVCLLSACSHAGLVEQGTCLFRSMCDDYRIAPELEHYACIIDLLGRAGHLSEAEDFLNQMPATPDIALWMSLLGACQSHSNVELGKRAFESILKLDITNVAAYVLMSNIYAACGMWDEEMDTRMRLRKADVRKKPGRSWLEVNCQVHSFVMDDKTHPDRKVIYDMLHSLTGRINNEEVASLHTRIDP